MDIRFCCAPTQTRLTDKASQFMPYQFDNCPIVEEDGWEIVSENHWRTSFDSVSWSYPLKKYPQHQHKQFYGPLFMGVGSTQSLPSPGSYLRPEKSSGTLCEDDALNGDLVGVKSALEAVLAYEEDVGFSYTPFPVIEPHELGLRPPVDLSLPVSEDLGVYKERWIELVGDLMNPDLAQTESDESLENSVTSSLSSSIDLIRCASTLSSIDFTSSDGSVDSYVMPVTPKAKSSCLVDVEGSSPDGSVDDGRDYSFNFSPGRTLNAAASSFIPTFPSKIHEEPMHFPSLHDSQRSSNGMSPPPSFTNFIFPTLNPPSSVKMKKDDQGFFTDIQVESASARSGKDLLPPFLQEAPARNRGRKSRTRQIVDRLRSQGSPPSKTSAYNLNEDGSSPNQSSLSPSPFSEETGLKQPQPEVGGVSGVLTPPGGDDDGWIDVVQPVVATPHEKAKRARELFLALRRRTDSQTSETLKEFVTGESISTPSQRQAISTSPSPPPHTSPLGFASTNDGWIEGHPPTSPEPQKKSKSSSASSKASHGRKQSSAHNSRPSISSASSQYPFSANPSSPPASYISHLHAHPSVHSHSHMIPASPAVPYFFPAYSMAVPVPVPYGTFIPMQAYPVGMPLHVPAPQASATLPVQYVSPQLIPTQATATKSPMTSHMNMNILPASTYKAKAKAW